MVLEAKHGNRARSHKCSRFVPNDGENIGTIEENLRESIVICDQRSMILPSR